MKEWWDKPESEWPIDHLPLTYFIFPNVHMSIGSVTPKVSLVLFHRIFPKSVGTMVTKASCYIPHGVESAEQLEHIKKGWVSTTAVVRDEDYSVTAESWSALSALPPGTKFAIGRQELGVQNFHRNVRRFAGHNGPA
jgi:hypothetical protein